MQRSCVVRAASERVPGQVRLAAVRGILARRFGRERRVLPGGAIAYGGGAAGNRASLGGAAEREARRGAGRRRPRARLSSPSTRSRRRSRRSELTAEGVRELHAQLVEAGVEVIGEGAAPSSATGRDADGSATGARVDGNGTTSGSAAAPTGSPGPDVEPGVDSLRLYLHAIGQVQLLTAERRGRAREADRARRHGRQAADGGGQPAARRLDRQGLRRPRAQLPRPDPGGLARPDPRRREVRLPPRLQVLDLRDLVDPPGGHPRDRRQEPDDPHPRPRQREAEPGPQRRARARPGPRPRAGAGRGRRRGRAAGRARSAS